MTNDLRHLHRGSKPPRERVVRGVRFLSIHQDASLRPVVRIG
jgi:hypothetical protein